MRKFIPVKGIIELEDRIANAIQKDNGRTIHFEYTDGKSVTTWTYNHQNKETFLLTKQQGENYIECLQKILDFVQSNEKVYNSYTVIWSRKGRTEKVTSYFRCLDVVEVTNKFFEGKDKNLYHVYEIKMNPIS
jgi:ATP-dependent RNA circularization protein (DNA/RNA ligase family)